jgi:hypothetical protein
MSTLTFTPDKPLDQLHVGDVVKVTLKLDGIPLTGGDIKWAQYVPALLKCDPLVGSTVPGQVQQFTAIADGKSEIICLLNNAVWSQPQYVTVAKAVTPPPPLSAPALAWPTLRPHISEFHTDFNYNWDQPHDWQGTEPTPMEIAYARHYDVTMSGSPYRHARLKKVNPNIKCIPYALLLSTLTNANGKPNAATEYCDDFDAWNAAHGISAQDAEAGWLHYPGQAGVAGRVTLHANVSSARYYPDPTNANMRAYQIDRMKRVCAPASEDGVFLDEYGSGGHRSDYALSCTTNGVTDAVRLQALCDAQVTLLAAVSAAMYPKQLIINSARYLFTLDAQEVRAARGTHMEQANDPMSLDWWNSVWPFIDARLAEGDFVNVVPLRDWGDYELLHDAQSPQNHMDTQRGKMLEVVGYYMVVRDKPQQLSLSFENGKWNVYTPVQNYLPYLDTNIGHPLEVRQYNAGAHYFTRRFDRGLVVMFPVWNRLAPNYGASGAMSIHLPTDRKYAQLHADGTVGPVVASVTLRCPEAAIFVCP